MYFNDEKNNTSIDKELSNKTIFSSLKNNIKRIIIIAVSIIILIILLFLIISLFKNRINFKLLGDRYIQLTEGSDFVDPGYIATTKNGEDISDEVTIQSNLDSDEIGTYQIIYRLRNKTLQRTIRVIENEAGKISIHLKGDDIIYIPINGIYDEPGYTCIDSIDGDITDKVIVTNTIDNEELGAYKVIYTVTNSTNITTTVSRVVIVK